MRIVTDLPVLARSAPFGANVLCFPMEEESAHWWRCFRMLLASVKSDFLIISFSPAEVVFFCAILPFIPGCRCRIVTLDLFVGNLFSMPSIPRALVCWALRRVYRFLVFFKDTALFENAFRVPASRFCYIPYKINGIEFVRATASTDGGYLFCGGRSRRDFATLFAAIEELGYPAKVVTSPEGKLNAHGSSLNSLKIPPNVELVQDDPDLKTFIEMAANARLVVVPIIKGVVTQTGIGVYLLAMALRKCVIISSGLGVSDVLTSGQAIVVPAGDVEALKQAIQAAWSDPDLRERYADAGYRYAYPLGGEDELAASVFHALW